MDMDIATEEKEKGNTGEGGSIALDCAHHSDSGYQSAFDMVLGKKRRHGAW